MIKNTLLASMAFTAGLSSVNADIVYEGTEGAGKGKHLVFIASDHEYRAEQTCPAIARILAKHHGFKCTVLFGTDENGFIEPGKSNIPGIEKLATADGLFFVTRFLDLPEDQMEHFIGYLNKGGPIVSLRTSSHAFKITPRGKYAKFSFNWKGEGFEGGFGQQYLGNSWEGHYGRNHVQGTRTLLIPEKKDDPILTGVEDGAFCFAGGYGSKLFDGMEPLTKSQPLVSMDPNSDPDPKKKPVFSSWKFSYKSADETSNRVFHSTQGASEDILDDNYRRLIINGAFWALGLESQIKADNDISFVGPYKPTTFGIHNWQLNVKPSDMAGFDTIIGSEKAIPSRKPAKKEKPVKKSMPKKETMPEKAAM